MKKPKGKKRYIICGFCNSKIPIPLVEVEEKRIIKCDCGIKLVITKLPGGKEMVEYSTF
ncbi:MAG: hypothetical protein WC614_07565 [bacterium]